MPNMFAWLDLNPNGTARLDVSTDPEIETWVPIPRATVGNVKRFGLMVEDADDDLQALEARIREEVGMTALQIELLAVLRGDEGSNKDRLAEAYAAAPDLTVMEEQYTGRLQRYLLEDDNPWPGIYVTLLDELGKHLAEPDDLPGWALGPNTIHAIVAHWQTAPLVGSTPPSPIAPNRAARRATTPTGRAKSTR